MARRKKPNIVKLELPEREKKILTVPDTVEILNQALNLFVSAKVADYSAAAVSDIVNHLVELNRMANNGLLETQEKFLKTVREKFN